MLLFITLWGSFGCENAPSPATVEAEIGASGGVVTLGSARLRVPPGALDSTTVIAMRTLSEADADELTNDSDGFGELVSVVVELTPHGLSFSRPITLELPYDEDVDGQPMVLERIEGIDGWTPVEAEFEDGSAAVRLEHFSWYHVRADRSGNPGGGTDAGDGAMAGGGGGGGPVEFACETGSTVDVGCRDTRIGCTTTQNGTPEAVVEIVEYDGDYYLRYNADGPGCRRVLGVVRRTSDDGTPAAWSTFELRHISVWERLGPISVMVPGRVGPAAQHYEIVWATYARAVACGGTPTLGCQRAGTCDISIAPQADQSVFMLDLPWYDMGATRKRAMIVNATQSCSVEAIVRETMPGTIPPEPAVDYTQRLDANHAFVELGELEVPSGTGSPPTRFGYELRAASLLP